MIQDMEFGDLCEYIKDTEAEWSRFVKNLKIPPKCPIEPVSLKVYF